MANGTGNRGTDGGMTDRPLAPVGSSDWERLSALADGELPDDESEALRARLAREPALADAFAAIERAKRDVRVWAGTAVEANGGEASGPNAPLAAVETVDGTDPSGGAGSGALPEPAPIGRRRRGASIRTPAARPSASDAPPSFPARRGLGGRAAYAIGGALAGVLAASLVALAVLPDAPGRTGGDIAAADGTATLPEAATRSGESMRPDGALASVPSADALDALAWHRALGGASASGGTALDGFTAAAIPPLDLSADGLVLARDVTVPTMLNAVDRDATDLEVDPNADVAGIAPSSSIAWLTLRHYRGPNGCAVTHLVAANGMLPPVDDTPLRRAWRVGGVAHALVAEGMDTIRFAALADYAEALSRNVAFGDGDVVIAHARSAEAKACTA